MSALMVGEGAWRELMLLRRSLVTPFNLVAEVACASLCAGTTRFGNLDQYLSRAERPLQGFFPFGGA